MMKRLLAFLFLIFFLYCNSKKENTEEIFQNVFAEGGRKNPKILFRKEVNLDLTPENEYFYVIRNGNEEIVVVMDNTRKNLLFKKIFTLLNIGPLLYDEQKKKWIAT
ncbi:MAG TPA: hypothetical protein PKD50_12520, partial [Leptospiraceae bacterium]|nr:hypothetical protein [Leptospiraceae bacterium]